MANEMKIFKSEQFGEIRTVVTDGQVGFVGKDVCNVLGYNQADKAITRHVEEDDRMKRTVTDSMGRSQLVYLISESGLYSLILSSKLPQAKAFKQWVTSEVLPQIRKTGGYIPVNEQDDEKTILSKAVMILQKTLAKKEELIEAQRPQVAFANALCGSNSSIRMSEMAKLLTQNGHEIGRTRLFGWMRRNGYIFKNSTEPKQEWVSRGYFEVKATLVETHHGAKESITPLITAEGQRYFLQKFCNS